MQEHTIGRSVQILVIAAIVAVVAAVAVWAGSQSAIAAGTPSSAPSPAATMPIQSESAPEDARPGGREDCPERGGSQDGGAQDGGTAEGTAL
jgi:hypothetical protein